MAIKPEDEYINIGAGDADRPYGSAINISAPGLFDATPLEKLWLNDLWGFLQKLLVEAGITPSEIPDTVLASDYWDALIDAVGRSMPIGGVTEFYGSSSPDPLILAESRDVLLKADYPELTTILGSYRPDLLNDVTIEKDSSSRSRVADSGEVIVIVGSEEVAISENGYDFNTLYLGGILENVPDPVRNVTYGDKGFHAVGDEIGTVQASGYVLVSNEGKSWRTHYIENGSGGVSPTKLYGIGFGGTGANIFYIACGENVGGDYQFFHGSLDNWVVSSITGSVGGIFYDIEWNGTVWCAVGNAGNIYTSPTGLTGTWTQQTPDGSYSDDFRGITSDDSGNFIIVGDSNEIQRSTDDGATWATQTPAGGFTGDFNDAHYTNGFFTIVGDDDEVQTSPTGITWAQRALGGSPTTQNLLSVGGVDRVCIAGATDTIQYTEGIWSGYNNSTEIVIPDMIPKNKNGYIPLMRAK